MSGSGPGGLNTRFHTNSFAYRNAQAYYPFYLVEKGNSFYGLSIPQYSHTTYHSLAVHGGKIGSNGRIGRYNRANNIPPTPFVPPNVSYLDQFQNSQFTVNGSLLDENEYEDIYFPKDGTTNNLNYWYATVSGSGDYNYVRAYGTGLGYDYVRLNSNNNQTTSIKQQVIGNILAGTTITINIYAERGPDSNQVGLNVILTSGSGTYSLITSPPIYLGTSFELKTITFTPTQTISNPTIEFQIYNQTGSNKHINIHSPSISLSN